MVFCITDGGILNGKYVLKRVKIGFIFSIKKIINIVAVKTVAFRTYPGKEVMTRWFAVISRKSFVLPQQFC